MGKDKRNLIIMIILFIIGIASSSPFIFMQGSKGEDIVPLFNLPIYLYYLILLFVWTTLGSILFLIIFTYILTPVFLMLKRVLWSKHIDSFVVLEEEKLSLKKFFKRLIYIFLLTFGLTALLIRIINAELLISDETRSFWTGQGITSAEYIPDAFLGLIYIIFPFVIGIWSLGWILEDASLMHYKLPKETEKKLYEIEPVHLKYNSMIKGYAGISSIIFFITVVIYYANSISSSSYNNILPILALAIYSPFQCVPAYLLYWKLFRPKLIKMLRKRKKSIIMISAKQLESQ